MTKIHVAGVVLRGSGYPNAEQTIGLLKRGGFCEVDDRADWLPRDTRMWRLVGGTWLPRVVAISKLLLRGFKQACYALRASKKKGEFVYAPYPSMFMLCWISLIPFRMRPLCIADAYISLWDSLARDRKKGTEEGMGIPAKILFHLERMALRSAWRVIVDTKENKNLVASDFGLLPDCVLSLPLAVDSRPFISKRDDRRKGAKPMSVLFFGTLIPLHGIDCVLGAVEALSGDNRFHFKIVGDGQESGLVEDFIRRASPRNLSWIRGWQELNAIADEVASADVCLGVFGGAGKASRVLPYKTYYAMAAGKPVVSQGEISWPEGAPCPPFSYVYGSTCAERSQSIVQRLLELDSDESLRSELERASADYFDRYLSAEEIQRRWSALIDASSN